MPSTLMTPSSDDVTLQKIASLIDDAKAGLALTVNSAMTVLYWDIGRAITEDLLKGEKPEYGDSSIASLADSLRAKYGKTFDRANLFRAIQFHQQFPEKEKVVSLSRQLSWSHILALLPIKDPLEREFYATLCVNEGWSVRVLRERKNSMLYERTAILRRARCGPGKQAHRPHPMRRQIRRGGFKLMGLDEGDIRVAQHLTKMPPQEEFEKRLALAIANAQKSFYDLRASRSTEIDH